MSIYKVVYSSSFVSIGNNKKYIFAYIFIFITSFSSLTKCQYCSIYNIPSYSCRTLIFSTGWNTWTLIFSYYEHWYFQCAICIERRKSWAISGVYGNLIMLPRKNFSYFFQLNFKVKIAWKYLCTMFIAITTKEVC